MNYPHITIIIPSYDINELDCLNKAINSVLEQNYDKFDIIVITEGEELTENIEKSYDSKSQVSINKISNPNGGVSVARNKGIEYAEGDIVAYLDSDAIAKENWLKNIGKIYAKNDNILAIGGKSIANWKGEKPWYLPDSFLWLVGVTHDGHPESGTIIRNTFGCNMSYRKEIFDEIDSFNTNLGKSHGFNLQGEEPELGIRMYNKFNTGMYYDENIIVFHNVEKYQTTLKWLSKRAYLQGITKSMMHKKSSNLDVEENYLRYLYLNQIPNKLKSIYNLKNIKYSIGSILGILYFTFLVGLGFIRGYLHRKLSI